MLMLVEFHTNEHKHFNSSIHQFLVCHVVKGCVKGFFLDRVKHTIIANVD